MASAGSARRVLFIVENLPSPFDRRVWQEATTLASAGYAVTIICPKAPGYMESRHVQDSVTILRHPMPFEANRAWAYPLEYSIALFWEFWLACKVFATRGFDAIHACNPPDTIFLIGLFFKLFGKRFVFDHHDINPELFEAKFGKRGWLYRTVCWLERATFWSADISIATNESYRRIAIERGKMDPDHVFVVRSGPDLRRMRIVPPVPAHRGGRKFLIGYVGVMGRQEGLQYLLRAAHHIVYELGRTDAQFALIGGGGELKQLQSLSDELGLTEFATFTGRIPDAELLEILNTADVCVNPDEHNPMNDLSTMNKIMEYMSLGKPIVQFDLTEGRVSAGDASLYAKPNHAVDLATKLCELLDDPSRRATMGAIGRRRVVDELSWPHEAPKLLAAYDQLWADSSAAALRSKTAPSRPVDLAR